jgi:tetratricopeptide (TPR) repeat protein
MKCFNALAPLLAAFFTAASLPAQPKLDSLYQAGLAAMQQYQYQQAQRTFYECHRSDPANLLYLEKLGQCYHLLGNLQEGRFYLKEVLKRDSQHAAALNLLAGIEEQLLDYRSARSRAEALVRLDSMNGYYRRLAGQLSEAMLDDPAAALHYHHALRLSPSDQLATVAYCKLLTEMGHLLHADSLMDAALRKQQPNLRLLYESAKLKYARKRFDEVLPRFQSAFALADTNLNFLPLYAFSLAQMDSCDAAMPWLRRLLSHSKKPNEQLHYFLGRCYQQSDSLTQAFTQYELAILAAQSPNI